MVLHHVAQGSSLLIKGTAPLNTDAFCGRDLHMINKIAVPDRLEDSIGKAKYQNVLNRFLAQIVINAKDLIFRQHLVDFVIQLPGRFQVVTERLFNNAADSSLLWMGHAVLAQLLHNL